jgi:hypothetical protein
MPQAKGLSATGFGIRSSGRTVVKAADRVSAPHPGLGCDRDSSSSVAVRRLRAPRNDSGRARLTEPQRGARNARLHRSIGGDGRFRRDLRPGVCDFSLLPTRWRASATAFGRAEGSVRHRFPRLAPLDFILSPLRSWVKRVLVAHLLSATIRSGNRFTPASEHHACRGARRCAA